MTFRVASTYEEVGRYLDRKFNYPTISESFTRDDFTREYDAAFDVVAEELSAVGSVNTLGFGDGDFSMSRYVDLNRSINIATYVRSAGAVIAAHAALQRIPEEYVVSFDADPSYVCVRRDGTVIGYSTDGDLSILRDFGFPNI